MGSGHSEMNSEGWAQRDGENSLKILCGVEFGYLGITFIGVMTI